MKISTALKASSWISGAAIVLTLVVLYGAYTRYIDSSKKFISASMIDDGVRTRALILDNYFLNREIINEVAFIEKTKQLLLIIEHTKNSFGEDYVNTLLQIENKINKTAKVADGIFSNDKIFRADTVRSEAAGRFEKMLRGQLLVDRAALFEACHRFSTEIYEDYVWQSKRLFAFITIIVSLCAVIIILNLSYLNRLMRKRVSGLQRGAFEISKGNFQYEIPYRGNDELAELSAAFNLTNQRIRDLYVELKAEISQKELRAAEAQELNVSLKQALEELEAINKELEGFTYSVSHDLRAPLRHIVGYVELLNKKAPESLDEKNRHYMEVISQAASQLGKLMDDLLSFSRMGRAEMTKTPLDPNQMVKEVIASLENEHKGRVISWNIHRFPEIHGDGQMLKIVFSNLITNALKFTRNQKNAVIEVGYLSEANDDIFFIKDNGVGFDMQYVGKLFNLFQRLHRADEFEGTGLGLANVRRIIARHGGRTWAEGKINEGATFYFSLPKQNHEE